MNNRFKVKGRYELPLKMNTIRNHDFMMVTYEAPESTPYETDEIREYAQQRSNALAQRFGPEGLFQITLKFEDGSYRASKMTNHGNQVSIWQSGDSEDIDHGEIVGFQITYSHP